MESNGINLSRLVQHRHQLWRLLDFRGRRVRRAYEALRKSYYRDYWSRAAAELGGDVEDLGSGFLRIGVGSAHTYVNGYNVQIDDHVLLKIAGDKALSQQLLRRFGLPVPAHVVYSLSELHRAEVFLSRLEKPVVVKPTRGGGGLGITTGIQDAVGLRRATLLAAREARQFMVEEQVLGDNYRFLYLDGELIDVVRRDPPTVIGDGSRSVRDLIAQENRTRLTGPAYTALSPLQANDRYLRSKGIDLRYVPESGQALTVKRAINQNAARDNHRVTAGVHPSYRELGGRVHAVLPIKLLGIDVITPSVAVPLEESGGAINEVNTTPGLHHHDLVAEQDKCNVGRLVLDYCLSSRSPQRETRAGATSGRR
jgi:cyanophycin synthetase